MSYEHGGRADKFGNLYESKFMVDTLVSLIEEKIQSVVVEPIGTLEEGVDVYTTSNEDVVTLYQCKGRNGNKDHWNLSDLSGNAVITKAYNQISRDSRNHYVLVSPIPRQILNDMAKSARNSSEESEEFYEFKIKNGSDEIKNEFYNLAKYLNLDVASLIDRSKIHSFLVRFSIEHFSDDQFEVKRIKERLEHLFVGNPDLIYNALLNYPIENDLLGRKITIQMINDYILKLGFEYKELSKSSKIAPRIIELNNEYKESFVSINNSFINRKVVKTSYDKLFEHGFLVIHGKAGMGKSGCTLGIIEKLEKTKICYLAIKLDTYIPKGNLGSFGTSLGLPSSPIDCIHSISQNEPVVLLLDQLDAIRWTNLNDNNAVNICKDIIQKIIKYNEIRTKKIYLVFVTRTFDMKNDIGISNILSKEDENGKKIFHDIEVDQLDEQQVNNILGSQKEKLPHKLFNLLRIPSNLYIWTKLDHQIEASNCVTSYDLVSRWWEQIINRCEKHGFIASNVDTFMSKYVNKLECNNIFSIPQIAIGRENYKLLDMLISQGLLILNKDKVSFVHQSFYDNFIVKKMIEAVYEGLSLAEIVSNVPVQSPLKRYQLQTTLEILDSMGDEQFINQGKKLLQDENVRFYIKYVFLEVLGQIRPLAYRHKNCIEELINNEMWCVHIIDAVIRNNIEAVEFLINNDTLGKWFNEDTKRNYVFDIIRSLDYNSSETIVQFLFSCTQKGVDKEIFYVLNRSLALDSDKAFELRLQLLRDNEELCYGYFDWGDLAEKHFNRALELLRILIKVPSSRHRNGADIYIGDRFSYDSTNLKIYSKAIIIEFSEYIVQNTKGEYISYDENLRSWSCNKVQERKIKRIYVEVLKKAISYLVKDDSEFLIEIFKKVCEDYSAIMYEIILESFTLMDGRYSDKILMWLCEDPNRRFFNYSGCNKNRLHTIGEILEKHSQHCSDYVFKQLEMTILQYKDEDMVEKARRRFEYNSSWRKTGNGYIVYSAYWGMLQNELLVKLCKTRTSKETKKLIEVLRRRFQNQAPYYIRNDVRSGTVSSTLQNNAQKLNAENWIELISSQFDSIRNHDDFSESSPEFFARDLKRVCKADTELLIKIANGIDTSIDEYYIAAIFDALSEIDNDRMAKVDINIIECIIVKLWKFDSTKIARAFCSLIRKRSDVVWSQTIVDILIEVACNHHDPILGKLNVYSYNDEKNESIEMLHTNSINCSRGCVFGAIANLIHLSKYEISTFEEAIVSGINDENIIVQMAVIECINAVSKDYKEKAFEWFVTLLKKDIRICGHPYTYNNYYYFYELNKEQIYAFILEMCHSENDEISELGYRHLANFYVIFNLDFTDLITSDLLTHSRRKTMIDLCARLFKNKDLRENCKTLIMKLLDGEYNYSNELGVIFYELEELEQVDIIFLTEVIANNSSTRIMRDFTELLMKTQLPIELFIDSVLKMSLQVIDIQSKQAYDYNTREISKNLSTLVVTLYERTKYNTEQANKWITIWDAMFEKRIGSIREISKELMS